MMDAMKDKRRFPRRPVNFKVNVIFSNRESSVLKARDISNGGMYIISDNFEQPYLGELLQLKLVEEPCINEVIPCEDAVVVHKGRHGFGLSFVAISDEL